MRPGLDYLLSTAICAVFSTACICKAILAAPQTNIEPLTSAALEAQLEKAQFDPAQCATVFGAHEVYVQQFTGPALERRIEWQSVTHTLPSTLEEARVMQTKGRAAAAAVDDAERPLLEAIRHAARPEQADAIARLLMQLDLRRDLSFAKTFREGRFADEEFDLVDATAECGLAPHVLTTLAPRLDQYLRDRQSVVRQIRDATLNVPLRRAEAAMNCVPPPRPELDRSAADAAQARSDYQAAMQAWMKAAKAAVDAMRTAPLAERAAARVKAVELDIRTLDAILPLLGGRSQLALLNEWWQGAGTHVNGTGAHLFSITSVADTRMNRLPPEVGAQVDGLCASWVTAWRQLANDAAITSAAQSGMMSMGRVSTIADATETAKFERLTTITKNACTEIASVVESSGSDRAPSAEEQAAIQMAMGNQPDGRMVNTLIGAAPVSPLDAIRITGFDTASPLPKLIQFEQLKPVFAAAGVDETMMGVTKTAIDDLYGDTSEITRIAQTIEATRTTPDGAFDLTAKNELELVAPEVRAQRIAERQSLRSRLLMLETNKLNELLPSIVPESGRAAVDWLISWRQLEGERAATFDARMWNFEPTPPDPVRAVFAANLAPADWKVVGPELAVVCVSLAERVRASSVATANQATLWRQSLATADDETARQSAPGAVGAIGVIDSEARMNLIDEVARTNDALQGALRDVTPRLKRVLASEVGERLQEAWDDLMYSPDLQDPTDLTTRFDGALTLVGTDAVREQVVALRSAWRGVASALRDRVVAIRSRPLTEARVGNRPLPEEDERALRVDALRFERNELNRRFFRKLLLVLGAERAARIAPLPAG